MSKPCAFSWCALPHDRKGDYCSARCEEYHVRRTAQSTRWVEPRLPDERVSWRQARDAALEPLRLQFLSLRSQLVPDEDPPEPAVVFAPETIALDWPTTHALRVTLARSLGSLHSYVREGVFKLHRANPGMRPHIEAIERDLSLHALAWPELHIPAWSQED